MLSCLSIWRELSSLENSRNLSTQATPCAHACQNRLLFAKRQRRFLKLHVGRAKHSGSLVLLVPFRKDLAWMNGTPQPNQKWLSALGIESWAATHNYSWLLMLTYICCDCNHRPQGRLWPLPSVLGTQQLFPQEKINPPRWSNKKLF